MENDAAADTNIVDEHGDIKMLNLLENVLIKVLFQ